jgi:hypothetical protein
MTLKEYFLKSKNFSVKHNNFFSIYEKELFEYKIKEFNLLEIGILHGGSLQMWKEYFPNAKIFGADINPRSSEFLKKEYTIIHGDQTKKKFWDKIKSTLGTIDILIDDGGHTNDQNISTIINALPLMSNKSKIIIEDTHASYMNSFGNPHRFSSINFCKTIIDSLNFESDLVYNKENISRISNINFYTGIVVIDINKELASKEKKIVFNSGEKINEDILSNKYENNFYLNIAYKYYKKFYSIGSLRKLIELVLYLKNFSINFTLFKKFYFFLKK